MSMMDELNQHKIAIVIVAGVGIGLYLLMGSSSAASSSGASSGSSTASPSGTGYTNALNTQYQDQLMSQALSNQAQLQSESVAGATQIGLAQAQATMQGQNLQALAYTGGVIGSVLANQNNNQAMLYANQGSQLTGQGNVGLGQIGNTNISTNQHLPKGSFSYGPISGSGSNL